MLLVLQCRKKDNTYLSMCIGNNANDGHRNWEKSTDLLDNPWIAGEMGLWGKFSVSKDSTRILNIRDR